MCPYGYHFPMDRCAIFSYSGIGRVVSSRTLPMLRLRCRRTSVPWLSFPTLRRHASSITSCGTMAEQLTPDKPPAASIHQLLDTFLLWLGTYAIPVAIVVLSLVAITGWQSYYRSDHAQPLAFQMIEQAGEPL